MSLWIDAMLFGSSHASPLGFWVRFYYLFCQGHVRGWADICCSGLIDADLPAVLLSLKMRNLWRKQLRSWTNTIWMADRSISKRYVQFYDGFSVDSKRVFLSRDLTSMLPPMCFRTLMVSTLGGCCSAVEECSREDGVEKAVQEWWTSLLPSPTIPTSHMRSWMAFRQEDWAPRCLWLMWEDLITRFMCLPGAFLCGFDGTVLVDYFHCHCCTVLSIELQYCRHKQKPNFHSSRCQLAN